MDSKQTADNGQIAPAEFEKRVRLARFPSDAHPDHPIGFVSNPCDPPIGNLDTCSMFNRHADPPC